MGRVDSPLRDRVIFIEGAPRSGTTWLVTLLATHPEIAGTQAESHLFDFGVDRLFDNLEYRDPTLHGLDRYLTREELVELVRDLCDGVLVAMCRHVAGSAEPTFVVEKTPIGGRPDGLDLERKRDCYPDGWFLHIVRDREAVIRSLMRAPFMADRTRSACAAQWDHSVGTIRRCFGELPRYREVSYERLRSDPVAECKAIYEWLGVAASERELRLVEALSRERFSELGIPPAAGLPTPRAIARAVLHRARARFGHAPVPEGSRLTFLLIQALRQNDLPTIAAITDPEIIVEFRAPAGDELTQGEAARSMLARLAEEVFDRRYAGEWWASAGGPGEWFSSAPDRPFWTVFFSWLGSDARRADLALGLTIGEGAIQRVVVLSAGPMDGRPIISQ